MQNKYASCPSKCVIFVEWNQRDMDQINIYSEGEVISRVFVEEEIAALDACLQGYGRVFAVLDRNVAMQCPVAAELAQMLNRRGVPGMLVDASEETKTIETVMDICGWLLDNGADRNALVLAIGGGITTDMAGFAASIYKRGVRFAYVPTTLLAQVDAAVGGKTGVNFDNYKNMLGVIRQPEFVYVCPRVLESLPRRDFLSGAAEMLKTFMIQGAEDYAKAVEVLFEMHKEYSIVPEEDASEYWTDCVGAHVPELTSLIAAAIRVKAGVVSRDQFEGGERRKLNLGHTFAHAIETLARREAMTGDAVPEKTDITHGEAVAMGLVLAARLSDRIFKGDMQTPTVLEEKVRTDLSECGLFPDSPFGVEEMAEAMHKDKKADGGKVHFVLMKEISDVTVYELTVDEVIRLLK